MHIDQSSPEQLTIAHTPWGLWIFGLLLLLISAGMLFGAGIGATVELACQRVELDQARCTVRRIQLGLPIYERSLADVREARVESSSGRRSSRNYRVVLVGAGAELPLTSYSSSGSQDKEQLANQVNRLISGAGPDQLRLSQFDWSGLFISGLLLAIGVFLSPLVTGLRITWLFDRLHGQLLITRLQVSGPHEQRIALAEVSNVDLQESRSSKGRRTHRIALRLRSGKPLSLTRYYGGTSFTRQRQAVDAIRNFLGLSLTESAASDTSEGLFQQGFQSYWASQSGDKSQAAALFRNVVRQDPLSSPAWLYLADSTSDPAERRDAYERVIGLDPTGPFGKRAAAALAAEQSPFYGPGSPARTGETVKLSAASFGPEPSIALPPVPGQASRPLGELLFGALALRAEAYRSIAHDPSLTGTAAILVLTVGLVTGFFGGLFPIGTLTINGTVIQAGLPFAALNMIVRALSDLVGWFVGATICALVAASFFRGLTNRGEMLRVFGFTSLFKLLSIFPLAIVPALIFSAIGVVIAVREAAEFDMGSAVATAAIATIIGGLISGIIGVLISALVLAPLTNL